MKSVCVYLGAKFGNSALFQDVVAQLGAQIALRNMRLVYGGSSLGLMGVLATSALEQGGKVTGIIPESLIASEKPINALDELIVTQTMQERKLLMQQKSDAFIVVPGGLGTLEETFDTWNAIKLGLLNKPMGFLNIDNYFNDLFALISKALAHGFIASSQAEIPKIGSCPVALMTELGLS